MVEYLKLSYFRFLNNMSIETEKQGALSVITPIAKTGWHEWGGLITIWSELNVDETKITSRLLENYALSVFSEVILCKDISKISKCKILRLICDECARIVGEYENPKWNVSKKSCDWVNLMSDELYDRVSDKVL